MLATSRGYFPLGAVRPKKSGLQQRSEMPDLGQELRARTAASPGQLLDQDQAGEDGDPRRGRERRRLSAPTREPRSPFVSGVQEEGEREERSSHLHLCAQEGQQKTLPPRLAGSEEPRPQRLGAGSPLTFTVPASLTVPVAQLNGLQTEVFDHLFTGAGGAVEGMIQARHLHFPTPFSSSPASYPGSLGGPCGKEGREREGEWRRESKGLGRGAESRA